MFYDDQEERNVAKETYTLVDICEESESKEELKSVSTVTVTKLNV